MEIDVHKIYKFKKSLIINETYIRVGTLAIGGFVNEVLLKNGITGDMIAQYVELDDKYGG